MQSAISAHEEADAQASPNRSSTEHSPKKEADKPMQKFSRDVLVNVAANLVAAAILYLLGVLFRLLPSNPGTLIASASTVLIFVGSSGLITRQFYDDQLWARIWTRISSMSFILAGIACFTFPFQFPDPWIWIPSIGTGIQMILYGAYLASREVEFIVRKILTLVDKARINWVPNRKDAPKD
jgi:hypothetical protein